MNGLGHLIYPNNCLICRKFLATDGQEILCRDCQSTIEINRPPFCLKCSRHVEDAVSYCRDCVRHPYHFDRAWAATLYNKTMQELIHRFKYQNKTSLRKNFLTLMLRFLQDHSVPMEEFDIAVPVPLHAARLRERGYNQAELLCENIAKDFCLKQSSGNLIRKRATRNQAFVKGKERWTNIDGAFTIKDSTEFHDKSVQVVDDLLTTGATGSEVARTLKKSGAKSVGVLTLAITQ